MNLTPRGIYTSTLPLSRYAPVGDRDRGELSSGLQVFPWLCPAFPPSCPYRGSHGSGQAPPPPADPDVRVSRIRLLGSWLRCAPVDGPHYDRSRQRNVHRDPLESRPREIPALRPAIQPVVPDPHDLVVDRCKAPSITGRAEVGIVAAELLREHPVLLRNRQVSIPAAPLRDPLPRPSLSAGDAAGNVSAVSDRPSVDASRHRR